MKTNNLDWYHLSQFSVKKMPLLCLLLLALSIVAAICRCLPLTRLSIDQFTPQWEEYHGSCSNASTSQLRPCFPLCCVFCSYFLPVFQAPHVTATGLLDFGTSLTLLYISMCTWDLLHIWLITLPRSWWLVLFSPPLFCNPSISQIP